MNLICKHCNHSFHSLLIPQEKALRDCLEQIGKHFQQRHPAAFQNYFEELQRLARALDSCLGPQRLFDIPPSETFALSTIQGAEDLIMDALGVDIDGEDESKLANEEAKDPSISISIDSGAKVQG
jgi:hypothetical protein